ncbi:MAG: hypothetical protein JNL54_04305 [Kineosporiaceae bacterium]|nr:hypothetical protein [Kineosporiaceae bacterium]
MSQTTSLTPSPASATSSADAAAAPAIAAYRQFFVLGLEATRDPSRFTAEAKPGPADFRAYAFDPILGEYVAFVMGLASDKVAYRGTPPTPRISVTTVDLAATPYPRVELSNCPTPAPTWKQYSVTTGQELVTASPSVAPPYRLAVEVIQHQGRWGVSKITADGSATCDQP